MDALIQAEDALVSCDLLFIVGTSAAVYPAAGVPQIAKRAGAKIVIVNPEPTDHLAIANACLQGTAGQVLPMLLQTLPQP